MDIEGYKQVAAALKEADIEALVAPMPQNGENIENFSIEVDRQTYKRQVVVEALGKHSLLLVGKNSSEPGALRLDLWGGTEIGSKTTILIKDKAAKTDELLN